ncbi:MAG: NAD-glutamate dehydrogenase, partial [Alphaproteobacteria bacterium]|nr:NAD-glutamate dehydrogenase [Alphaproteobacteria bacterium]
MAASAAARGDDPSAVAAFARAFYAKVPADDLQREEVDSLAAGALSMWSWMQQRPPAAPVVRAFNPWVGPDGGTHGIAWSRRDTVVEIVNDDMPFLVASVTAALNKRGATVRLVIHPILRVKRDASGRLLSAGEAGARAEAGAAAESVMQLRIVGQPSPEALDAVTETVRAVLADVRAAVEDWGKMRACARAVIDELAGDDLALPAADKTDAAALLQWIVEDHFTFLGYREYAYAARDGMPTLDVDARAGLGLLRDPGVAVFDGLRNFAALPPEVREFLRQPKLLLITKANRVSTVHRQAPLDALFLKRFDPQGRILGERVFVGLFTSSAYSQSATEIPVLSRKIAAVLRRAGAAPESHDGKALIHILETYPRDELLQVDEDTLLEAATGILDLQQRPRIALFVRRDPFARFMSCLVYIPLDLYSAELRERLVKILEAGFGGACSTLSVRLGDEALARLHATIAIAPGSAQAADVSALEARLAEAGRSWLDGLRDTLDGRFGAERGDALFRRFGQALPASYREAHPAARAADDIAALETVRETRTLAVRLRAPEDGARRMDLAVVAPDEPLPLFAILPVLEHMGLKVIGEEPTILQARRQPGEKDLPDDRSRFSVQHFSVEPAESGPFNVAAAHAAFEDAVVRVWRGQMEDDGFNALVLRAGLEWRAVTLLRAVAKYLRQAAIPFPQETMERALLRNIDVTRALVSLFNARFDPAGGSGREKAVAESRRLLAQGLEQVAAADDDRILRRYANVLDAMTRTNFYQRQDGGPKPHLSFKLDSAALDDLPKPRPWREIFVYAPSVEGVHLRGGRVARGGLRWSDRREDFRTEVLGLMKAQMVKNAVIVPVGSKGGFVVKRPPPAAAGRDAALAEGIACYRTFLRGLLDVTDNRVG